MRPACQRPGDYEAIDAGRVLARADARARLEALGLGTLEGVFAREGAERRGRYKALLRLRDERGAVFVKRYDFARPEVWLRGALKANLPVFSGPRELENLLALAAAGLRVPLPLAAGQEDQGLRRRSFVALAALAGTPLDALPAPAAPAERRARIEDVAALARRLHEAGFWHKDLYLCNLFHAPGEPLGLLDCERVGFRPGGPPWRWRVKDLAALDYSATWPTRAERLRFLRAYLAHPLDEEARRLARAVRAKAARLARRGRKGP